MPIPIESAVVFWASLSSLIGIIGIVAAFRAWHGISAEKKTLEDVTHKLVPSEIWDGAHPYTEAELLSWMQRNQIVSDSHVGDFFRAAWSAWRTGRKTALAEFHTLAAKRERVRISSRLSGGIAALLLVIGIVGTLSSVKPILKNFKIQTSENGDVQDAAQSASRVNELVNSLGDAFWPSLLALVFTILVVGIRGLYTITAQRFSLDLDRFALGTLLPKYKTPTLADDLGGLQKDLSKLTERLLERDTNFADVVSKLETLVESIKPAMDKLEQAVSNSEKASDKLSTRSASIAEGLKKTLGSGSPVHKAITGLSSVFDRTEETVQKLSKMVERVGQDHEEHQEHLKGCVAVVEDLVDKLPEAISLSTQDVVNNSLDKVNELLRTRTDNVAELRDQALRAIGETSSKLEGHAIEAISQQSKHASVELFDAANLVKKSTESLIADIGGKIEAQVSNLQKEAKEIIKAREKSAQIMDRNAGDAETRIVALKPPPLFPTTGSKPIGPTNSWPVPATQPPIPPVPEPLFPKSPQPPEPLLPPTGAISGTTTVTTSIQPPISGTPLPPQPEKPEAGWKRFVPWGKPKGKS